jgi:hypothetical protein
MMRLQLVFTVGFSDRDQVPIMKTTLLTFIGLVAFVPAVAAQVTLEIKHQEKSTLTTRTDVKIAQTLQLMGQEIITKNAQVLVTEHATGALADDGTLRTKVTIKKWTGKWEFPGGIAMEFDSEVPDRKAPIAQLEPILEIVRVVLKTPITQIFNKDGSVKTAEVPEGAAKDLPKEFKNDLSPEKITAVLKEQHAILPDKAVSKGDTWTRDQEVRLGGFREVTFRIDFQYEGTVRKDGRELDRISGKVTDVAYTGEDWREGPGLVKNTELKPAKSSVEALFDRKLGRFVETKLLVQVKGDLTLEAGDKEFLAKVDITFEQGMKVLPPEKK